MTKRINRTHLNRKQEPWVILSWQRKDVWEWIIWKNIGMSRQICDSCQYFYLSENQQYRGFCKNVQRGCGAKAMILQPNVLAITLQKPRDCIAKRSFSPPKVNAFSQISLKNNLQIALFSPFSFPQRTYWTYGVRSKISTDFDSRFYFLDL